MLTATRHGLGFAPNRSGVSVPPVKRAPKAALSPSRFSFIIGPTAGGSPTAGAPPMTTPVDQAGALAPQGYQPPPPATMSPTPQISVAQSPDTPYTPPTVLAPDPQVQPGTPSGTTEATPYPGTSIGPSVVTTSDGPTNLVNVAKRFWWVGAIAIGGAVLLARR